MDSGTRRRAEEQADGGAVNAFRVGRWCLREDETGISGRWDSGHDPDVERSFAESERGGPFGLTNDVRYRDLLGTKTFGDADGPLAPDDGTGCRELTENVAGSRRSGIEAVL